MLNNAPQNKVKLLPITSTDFFVPLGVRFDLDKLFKK